MRERAQDRFIASCSAGDGGVVAGEGGRGRAELGNRFLRRVDRRGGRRVGGWRWAFRRESRYLFKKSTRLSEVSLSIFLFLFSSSTLTFWRAHREFVCNLKGGKGIRDRRDAIRGRNCRTISTKTRSPFFSSGDRGKSKMLLNRVGPCSFRRA